MIAWLRNLRVNRARRRRFIVSVESILLANGAALIGLAKRQEELFEIQSGLTKYAVSGFESGEMVALILASLVAPDQESSLNKARAVLRNNAASRKALLDAVARMESESDARRCQIEQLEKMLRDSVDTAR